jgi:hypothetical protein
MIAIGLLFVRMLCDCFKPRQQLQAEILVLRHQLNVLRQRAPPRPHLRWADRALFIWLYRRVARDLEPQQLPPAVAQDQKRKQSLKSQGRNHTDNGGDRLRVVAKERLPALRGRPTPVASEKSDSFVTVM